ncbi:MAG: alpha-ribazole phosphatase [Bacteroidales bacterium]
MRVHLLRHTKPEIEGGICYGQIDIGVSKTYSNELTLIKSKVSSITFDSIFSSPLKRCVLLAESLCPENIEIKTDDRLKEMSFGKWEMMNWQDIAKGNEAREWFNDYVNVKCPNGESFTDLHSRVKDFLNTIKGQSLFQDTLIITHAGVIRTFYSIVKSVSLKESFGLKIGFGELKTFQL